MVYKEIIMLLHRALPSPDRRRPGPDGYTDVEIALCLLLAFRLQVRSLRHLVRLLHSCPAICRALHLPSVPSVATLSRRFRRLAPSLWALCRRLSRLLDPAATGVLDATGLRTCVQGSSRGWCGAFGHFRGVKIHAVVTPSGLLRDFAITPGNVRESHVFFPGTGLALPVGHKGYDSERLMARYAAAGTCLVAPARRLGRGGPRTPLRRLAAAYLASPEGRELLRTRSAVERFFAWLKGQPLLTTPVASVAHLTRTVLLLWLGQVLRRAGPLAVHAFVW